MLLDKCMFVINYICY